MQRGLIYDVRNCQTGRLNAIFSTLDAKQENLILVDLDYCIDIIITSCSKYIVKTFQALHHAAGTEHSSFQHHPNQ